MLLLDANILIYAYDTSSKKNEIAVDWLENQVNSSQHIALPWATINAFLRIITNKRIMSKPFSYKLAVETISYLLKNNNVFIPQELESHWITLSNIIISTQANSNLIPDAYLAALAIDHGATLCTSDSDFKKFDNLKLHYPLK